MIKQPFRIDSILYSYMDLKALNLVVDIFREVNAGSKLGTCILLEDFGSTLEQSDWTDTIGHYVSYRISPSYERHHAALAAVEQLKTKLAKLLHRHPSRRIASDIKNDVVTMYYIAETNSIGD
ncbi:MAG: hypothetical protein EBT27_04420 [Betaproteobacteria bacterium]|nr:hypothetical protein [Betaproteobacteria bacterium]